MSYPIHFETYISEFPMEFYKIYSLRDSHLFFIDQEQDLIKSLIVRNVPWEPHITDLLQDHIRKDSVVIDVGAHIGTHTMSMAQYVGGEGKVIAFEPNPKIFRELHWNCQLNALAKYVELHPLALSNEDKIVSNPNFFNTTQTTLDSFQLQNVSLIKIDVEGVENTVLEGAQKTLLENRPAIIIEICGGINHYAAAPWMLKKIHHTKKLLRNMGYHVEQITGCPKGFDYLALPL